MFYEWLKKINEADESGWPDMLNAINPSSLRQYGKSHRDDHTARVVAADYLDDLGRGREAALLRNPETHVYRHNGQIHNAHKLSHQFHTSDKDRRGNLFAINSLTPDERQYLEIALWAEIDEENQEPLDDNYNLNDIHSSTLAAMISDWRSFNNHARSLGILKQDPEQNAPRDFWLSRNGHSDGFFNHPEYYGREQAKELQELARRYGEYNLYVADDLMIHGSYHIDPET